MPPTRKTILVVEDSPSQALALKQLLEQEGLTVLHALNGRDGITLAERHAPDAIVLDLHLPEMDGFQTCRQLKVGSHTAHIPVVMLTAHASPPVLLYGFDLGAVDFISKGAFAMRDLLQTLRQLHILHTASGSDR